MYPVLLMDPQAKRAARLATILKAAGFRPREAATADVALQAMSEEFFVAVVVAADLDDDDCLARLVEFREKAAHTWMIVVAPRCDEETRDLIFRHGGDACIAAPASAADLITRLEAFRLRWRPSF